MTNLTVTGKEIIGGLLDWRRWLWLGFYDIRLTNRRSFFGMWWPALSLAIFSFGVGQLFAALQGRAIEEFLPHVVVGWLTWQMIAGGVSQGCQIFVQEAQILKEALLSPNTIVLRVLTRYGFQFFQGLLVVAAAYIYVGKSIGWGSLWVPVGLILNLFVLHGVMLFLGVLGARFRDVSPLIDAGIRLSFFLTPIIWIPSESVGVRSLLVDMNPFYYMIEIIRGPLGANSTPLFEFGVVFAAGVAANIAGVVAILLSRHRVIYWV